MLILAFKPLPPLVRRPPTHPKVCIENVNKSNILLRNPPPLSPMKPVSGTSITPIIGLLSMKSDY